MKRIRTKILLLIIACSLLGSFQVSNAEEISGYQEKGVPALQKDLRVLTIELATIKASLLVTQQELTKTKLSLQQTQNLVAEIESALSDTKVELLADISELYIGSTGTAAIAFEHLVHNIQTIAMQYMLFHYSTGGVQLSGDKAMEPLDYLQKAVEIFKQGAENSLVIELELAPTWITTGEYLLNWIADRKEIVQEEGSIYSSDLSEPIKIIESKMEELRNRRQERLTEFENFDQKTKELFSLLSDVLKSAMEMQKSVTSQED